MFHYCSFAVEILGRCGLSAFLFPYKDRFSTFPYHIGIRIKHLQTIKKKKSPKFKSYNQIGSEVYVLKNLILFYISGLSLWQKHLRRFLFVCLFIFFLQKKKATRHCDTKVYTEIFMRPIERKRKRKQLRYLCVSSRFTWIDGYTSKKAFT